MRIEQRPLASITPYERNPRDNAAAVEPVARSIREFGFQQPIVVDGDGVIVVGHTRYLAARQLGLEAVPVVVANGLTPEQIRAYRLADNRLGEIARWDYDLLPIELGDLRKAGFDLDLIGFDADDLAKLLDGEPTGGLTDPDAVPEPPEEPVTRRGNLWILGDHRLLCGDSASQADLDRLLDGEPVHLVNTDPPYNVRVEPRSNNAIAAGHCDRKGGERVSQMRAKDRPLENDFITEEAFERLLDAWFGNCARVLLPGHSFYMWGGYTNCGNYPPALKRHGLYFSQAIIWVKEHPSLTRKDYMGNHEWCMYGWREGAAHRFFGDASATDVWSVKKINPTAMVHLTEKPVELAVRAIRNSSMPGEHVLDIFGGSGSTLIGCEQTRRRAFLMELDPAYCDIICQRWMQFTGKDAKLKRAQEVM